MQIRPELGPLRRAGDDRDVGVRRQVHQQLDEDVLPDGIRGSFSPAQSLGVHLSNVEVAVVDATGALTLRPAGPVTAARQVPLSSPRSGTARSRDGYSSPFSVYRLGYTALLLRRSRIRSKIASTMRFASSGRARTSVRTPNTSRYTCVSVTPMPGNLLVPACA